MKINAIAIRPGNVLNHNGKLYVVSKIMHTQPGKGGAYMQVEMKTVLDGTKVSERFRSSEDVERVHLDETNYQYLFADNDNVTFMNNQTYEQIAVDKNMLGDSVNFLTDGMEVTLVSYEGRVVSVDLPEEVTLEIAETEAVIRGQTASSSYKPAILSNGTRTAIPPFVEVGDRVIVKTSDGSYVGRVNTKSNF